MKSIASILFVFTFLVFTSSSIAQQDSSANALVWKFYLKGKKMGDYVACMESDRVFEIIRQLTEKSIPVLTVYDAFIVQKQYEDFLTPMEED